MATRTDVSQLLADIDAMDAKAFASHLSADCVLRYANTDEQVGREAIEAGIAGFYETIAGLEHHLLNEWEVDDTTILQFEVTYRRLDGGEVTVPAVTIFRRGDELIDEYRIYVDLAPVYA